MSRYLPKGDEQRGRAHQTRAPTEVAVPPENAPPGPPWHTGSRMDVRVGIDLVAIQDVARALDDGAERYVDRVYTPAEVAACTNRGGLQARRLAAHFAAKEATVKLLQAGDDPIPWRSIELRRPADGSAGLHLSGAAADHAERAGFGELRVSVSTSRTHAAAVVAGGIAHERREEVV